MPCNPCLAATRQDSPDDCALPSAFCCLTNSLPEICIVSEHLLSEVRVQMPLRHSMSICCQRWCTQLNTYQRSDTMSRVQLWHAYLTERRAEVRGLPIGHPALDNLLNTYERALVSMHKMPRVWIEFCDLLVDQRFVTRARRAFDRAICALPITQHDRIWQLYLVSPASTRMTAVHAQDAPRLGSTLQLAGPGLCEKDSLLRQPVMVQKFLMQAGIPTETAARVYRRYLKLEPTHAEEYIAYLRSKVGSACVFRMVFRPSTIHLRDKGSGSMWQTPCACTDVTGAATSYAEEYIACLRSKVGSACVAGIAPFRGQTPARQPRVTTH